MTEMADMSPTTKKVTGGLILLLTPKKKKNNSSSFFLSSTSPFQRGCLKEKRIRLLLRLRRLLLVFEKEPMVEIRADVFEVQS